MNPSLRKVHKEDAPDKTLIQTPLPKKDGGQRQKGIKTSLRFDVTVNTNSLSLVLSPTLIASNPILLGTLKRDLKKKMDFVSPVNADWPAPDDLDESAHITKMLRITSVKIICSKPIQFEFFSPSPNWNPEIVEQMMTTIELKRDPSKYIEEQISRTPHFLISAQNALRSVELATNLTKAWDQEIGFVNRMSEMRTLSTVVQRQNDVYNYEYFLPNMSGTCQFAMGKQFNPYSDGSFDFNQDVFEGLCIDESELVSKKTHLARNLERYKTLGVYGIGSFSVLTPKDKTSFSVSIWIDVEISKVCEEGSPKEGSPKEESPEASS